MVKRTGFSQRACDFGAGRNRLSTPNTLSPRKDFLLKGCAWQVVYGHDARPLFSSGPAPYGPNELAISWPPPHWRPQQSFRWTGRDGWMKVFQLTTQRGERTPSPGVCIQSCWPPAASSPMPPFPSQMPNTTLGLADENCEEVRRKPQPLTHNTLTPKP